LKEYLQVVTTLDEEAKARSLAKGVVEARLAACAQVSGPIVSFYWWKGEMEEADEYLVIMKTTRESYPSLERFIKERHPYSVPEILAFPVVAGNEDYLEWLEDEVDRKGEG